jgi:biopolymer transport protein ExbD
MKIRSPLPRKRVRLEIIPLIDIMFFLLASFMMVSLQMQKVRALKASLPTATLATSHAKPDIINLTVDKDGQVLLENHHISLPDLFTTLTNRVQANASVPVYVHGDREATHGSIVFALDLVKRAGVQRVAIAVDSPAAHP